MNEDVVGQAVDQAYAAGYEDGRRDALAPVLALVDEWGTTYAAQRLRAAVASHQEGGA